MMKLKFTTLIGLYLLLAVGNANSSVLTYQFSGFITQVAKSGTSFTAPIEVGDPWSATISIDDIAPDQFPGPLGGVYQGLDFIISIGSSLTYTNADFLNLGLEDTSVSYNNANGSADNIRFNILTDALWGVSSNLNVDGFRVSTTNIELATPDSPLFSEALSSVYNFDLAEFSAEKRFVVVLGDAINHRGMEITGNFTSFTLTPTAVPIPAAAWLFGTGLLGLLGLKRRAIAG